MPQSIEQVVEVELDGPQDVKQELANEDEADHCYYYYYSEKV